MRSAHAVGADAIASQGACGLTATAVKAAAGAAEHVPICRVDNIQKALQKVRALGVWTIGIDARGDTDFTSVDYSRACALVVGSEGRGLRRMVGERCDFLVSIPWHGEVGSLNASVAAGIVLYEVPVSAAHEGASASDAVHSARGGADTQRELEEVQTLLSEVGEG